MNRIRILSTIILFVLVTASRSEATIQKSQMAGEANETQSQAQVQQSVNNATPTPRKPAQQNNTATPEAPTNTVTPQPTNTQTPVAPARLTTTVF